MKHNIKMKIERKVNRVSFKILEMSEKLRVRVNHHGGFQWLKFVDKNGREIVVRSSGYPELRDTTIYLRGRETERDKDMSSYYYGSKPEAIQMEEALKIVVSKINELDLDKAKPSFF